MAIGSAASADACAASRSAASPKLTTSTSSAPSPRRSIATARALLAPGTLSRVDCLSASAPSEASEVLLPRCSCAEGVAAISVPSSVKMAIGSPPPANSRVTRSLIRRSGPARSAAATRMPAVPSASATREQAQASARPMPAPKPSSCSVRSVPSGGSCLVSLATCAAVGCPRSKLRAASAEGVAAPKIAAPVGLAQSTLLASNDHSHAGVRRSASARRRGSCSHGNGEPLPLIAHRYADAECRRVCAHL